MSPVEIVLSFAVAGLSIGFVHDKFMSADEPEICGVSVISTSTLIRDGRAHFNAKGLSSAESKLELALLMGAVEQVITERIPECELVVEDVAIYSRGGKNITKDVFDQALIIYQQDRGHYERPI